jgi:hypothetical protein
MGGRLRMVLALPNLVRRLSGAGASRLARPTLERTAARPLTVHSRGSLFLITFGYTSL